MIQEPLLMQNQNGPFNCDTFITKKILELKKEFKIKHAIELGTCLGYSAEWFGKNFHKVDTIEINKPFLDIAKENRLNNYTNVTTHLGSSVEVLPTILKDVYEGSTPIIFQDSHWSDNWPARKELEIILNSGLKPVIVVHDFFVPEYDTVLGYDSFNNVPLSLSYIEDLLKLIYDGNFSVEYNSPDTAEGAMRGVAYIKPI